MKREPEALVGKLLDCYVDQRFHPGTALIGHRRVRITKVNATQKGELRGLSVRYFNAVSGKYDGRVITLQPPEWSGASHGVIWRKKLVPVNEWLGRAAP